MKKTVLAPLLIGTILTSCGKKETTAKSSTSDQPAKEQAVPAATQPEKTPAKPAVKKDEPILGEWLATGDNAKAIYSYDFSNGDLTILTRDEAGEPADITVLAYKLTNIDGNRAIAITDEENNRLVHLYTISKGTLTLFTPKGETLSTWKRQ